MPYQVVWAQCNVFDPEGEATTLQRGQYVPDDLDEVQTSQLAVVGAIRFVDSSLPPLPSVAVMAQSAPLEEPPPEPSDEWTVEELKQYAEDNDIDLGGARAKADILAAVKK